MQQIEAENRKFLSAYDASLLEEIEPDEAVEVMPARKGGLTLKVDGRFVHGKYSPERDAETLIGKISEPPQNLHLHFGFGLGYLLRADHAAEDGQIVIFEPHPGIAAAALAHVPLAELFVAKRARLFVTLERFRRFTKGLLGPNAGMRIVVNPYHLNAHAEAYQEFSEAIRHEHNRGRLMQGAGVKKIFRGFLDSTIRSLPYTTRLPGVNRLVDAFKNKPAIIVAAGPSLDKNIADLAQVGENALIFAISRAVRPLETMGIRPHFLVQTESKNYLYLIERCTNLTHTTLLLADQCHAGYFQFPSRYKFCYQNPGNSITSWLVSRFPQLNRQFLATAGSVATDAFSLALITGCNPIILVGQDLALSKARYYAAAETNIAFRHKKDDLVPTHGYFGGQVPTITNYLYFTSWYEDAVKVYKERYPDRIFINATEGGARLRGFRRLKFRDVARQYLTEKVDPAPALEEASLIPATFTMTPQQLENFVGEVRQKLESLLGQCKLFQSFAALFSKALDQLNRENLSHIQLQLDQIEHFQNVFLEYCNDLKPLVSFCDHEFQAGVDIGDHSDLASLGKALREDLARVSFNWAQLELAAQRFDAALSEIQPDHALV